MLGWNSDKGFSAYFILYLAFLYVPLLVLLVFSFNDSIFMTLPLTGFTLKWYGAFFSNESATSSVVNSFTVALVSTGLATISGLMAAFALVRHRFRGRSVFLRVAWLPLVIPYVVMGVSLLILFHMLGVALSLFTVTLGHTIAALPYTTLVLTARLIGFDTSLEEAAMDLGADESRTFLKVTLPLIFPGIVSAAFLAFTVSFGDVTLAYFLIGYENTLPIYVFGSLRYPSLLPVLTVTSTLMICLSIALSLLIALVRGK